MTDTVMKERLRFLMRQDFIITAFMGAFVGLFVGGLAGWFSYTYLEFSILGLVGIVLGGILGGALIAYSSAVLHAYAHDT